MKRVFFFLVFLIFCACTSDNEASYFGCMDNTAMNYDPAANIDDDSCLFAEGCMDSDACNFNEYAIIYDESCEYPDTLDYQSLDNNDIAAIITNKCLTCHDNPSNSAYDNPSLDYSSLQMYGLYLLLVLDGSEEYTSPMPPSGKTQLTDCERLEIEIWINNGHEPGL